MREVAALPDLLRCQVALAQKLLMDRLFSMAPRLNPVRLAATGAASWMALVAATTLGAGNFGHLRAQISADSSAAQGNQTFRLIVQSYDAACLDGELPGERAKPLSSIQRAVTAEELQRGISVDLVQLGTPEELGTNPVVVAWVEAGEPDLEFDAATARPDRTAIYGVGRLDEASPSAQIVLRRSVA